MISSRHVWFLASWLVVTSFTADGHAEPNSVPNRPAAPQLGDPVVSVPKLAQRRRRFSEQLLDTEATLHRVENLLHSGLSQELRTYLELQRSNMADATYEPTPLDREEVDRILQVLAKVESEKLPSQIETLGLLPKPVQDIFTSRLAQLKDAETGFGRYAYLISVRMPRPDDPSDLTARVIEVLEKWQPPASIKNPAFKLQYAMVYLPSASTTAPPSGESQAWWNHGYGLELANEIKALACKTKCRGAGPWLVITTEPIRGKLDAEPAVFNFGGAAPSMAVAFTQRFRKLVEEGRDWSSNDPPGHFFMLMRKALADVGGFVLTVAGTVASLKKVQEAADVKGSH
jgi:hypothetical protein